MTLALFEKTVINLRILRGGAYSGLSRESLNPMISALVRVRPRETWHMHQGEDIGRRGSSMAAETDAGGSPNQGMPGANTSWKMQGSESFQEPSKGVWPC